MKDINEDKKTGVSRRKFVKIAAATAYAAPLIMTMPAKALASGGGSGPNRPNNPNNPNRPNRPNNRSSSSSSTSSSSG